MPRPSPGSAVIGQSGGPTAVINQSLAGCVEGLLAGGDEVGAILGARHGVSGIIDDRFIDLRAVPSATLDRIANTPSSGLGSSRDKPDAAYCAKIVDALARKGVRYFFYIGGNDSSDTCRLVSESAGKQGYELRAFHVPKTIDNDLMRNDHCPGFPSAARFVACAVTGDDLDNRALPGIKVDVIMGRHAGFLTAASLLARRRPGDGPHLIYVPEVPFEIDRFIADVDRVYKQEGRCVAVVSEGIHDAAGTAIASKLAQEVEKDAHGNVQLSGSGALGDHLAQRIRDRLGQKLRVRADTFGYLQRSFLGCVSEVDRAEARAAGRRAAEEALAGRHRSGSIALERVRGAPYECGFGIVPLAAVAAQTRKLPVEFVAGHCDIAPSFRDYLEPLVGRLPEIETFR